MSFYSDILAQQINTDLISSILESVLKEPEATAEMVCYQAICKIRAILDDDSLSDPECFMKIEEIVNVLEDMGSGGGCRHDFG